MQKSWPYGRRLDKHASRFRVGSIYDTEVTAGGCPAHLVARILAARLVLPAATHYLFYFILRDAVRKSIDQLPESYREILLLRDIEELTADETAEALGISKNVVKVRLHRARQALRTLLDPSMRTVPA